MDYTLVNNEPRGSLIEVHIADIHFGAMDPNIEYNILKEQFLIPISLLPKIDIVSIDGDLFDRKLMAGSEVTMYVSMFIGELVQICKQKNATLVMISGTSSHQDPSQLKLFYHYLSDPEIDIRIVETIKFEYIKGAKILCIPELYGIDESIYRHFFFESGWYDEAFIFSVYFSVLRSVSFQPGSFSSAPQEKQSASFLFLPGPGKMLRPHRFKIPG